MLGETQHTEHVNPCQALFLKVR